MATEVKICPRCHHENDMYADHCAKCGYSIDRVQPRLPQESSPPPGEKHSDAPVKPPQTSPGGTERIPEARLVLDEDPRLTFALQSGMILGRGEQAQIDLSSVPRCKVISRRHAQFFFDQGRWYVEDLKSTNCTTLNGQKLTPGRHELTDGVRIALGNVAFTFRLNV